MNEIKCPNQSLYSQRKSIQVLTLVTGNGQQSFDKEIRERILVRVT